MTEVGTPAETLANQGLLRNNIYTRIDPFILAVFLDKLSFAIKRVRFDSRILLHFRNGKEV